MSINFVHAQTNNNNIFTYESKSLDGLNLMESVLYDNINYHFFSNQSVAYLVEFIITPPEKLKLNFNPTGKKEDVCLDYEKSAFYKFLDVDTSYVLKDLHFKKIDTSKTIIRGYKTSKYVSKDGSITVYSTKDLPWQVQPCVITQDLFNGGIVKLVNNNSKFALELSNYETQDNLTDDQKNKIEKIQNKQSENKVAIIPPMME